MADVGNGLLANCKFRKCAIPSGIFESQITLLSCFLQCRARANCFEEKRLVQHFRAKHAVFLSRFLAIQHVFARLPLFARRQLETCQSLHPYGFYIEYTIKPLLQHFKQENLQICVFPVFFITDLSDFPEK